MAVQDAVELITTACTQWNLGYDQHNRLDFRNGGETDCSALVIITCEQTGLLPGNNIRKSIGARTTHDMRREFMARGWRALPNLAKGELRPGDVLLNDSNHTAMYVGNGRIAAATIDENGKINGGATGDQNGRETVVQSYYNYPWSCVLRFHGTAGSGPAARNSESISGSVDTGTTDLIVGSKKRRTDTAGEISLRYTNGLGLTNNVSLRIGLIDNSGRQFTTTRVVGPATGGTYTLATDVLAGTEFRLQWRPSEAVSVDASWSGTLTWP